MKLGWLCFSPGQFCSAIIWSELRRLRRILVMDFLIPVRKRNTLWFYYFPLSSCCFCLFLLFIINSRGSSTTTKALMKSICVNKLLQTKAAFDFMKSNFLMVLPSESWYRVVNVVLGLRKGLQRPCWVLTQPGCSVRIFCQAFSLLAYTLWCENGVFLLDNYN